MLLLAVCLCSAFGQSSVQEAALRAFDSSVRMLSEDEEEETAAPARPRTSQRAGPALQRKRPTPLQSKRIAARQNFLCDLCGQMLDATWEIDHILPLRHGGSNDESNLRALHRGCHQRITSSQNMAY